MDENNIDLLVKKRTEEIKKERENPKDESVTTPSVEEKATTTQNCDSVDQTIKTVKKVQRWSILWKLLALVLIIGVNILWFQNIKLKDSIEDLELEVISMLNGGGSHTYLGEEIGQDTILQLDNRIMVNADFVMNYIDTTVHYSNSGTRVYIPLEAMDYQLETKELTDYVKKNIVDINVPILKRDDINYIDFEILKKLYNLNLMTALDGSFAIYKTNSSDLIHIQSDVEFVKTSHGMKHVQSDDVTTLTGLIIGSHEDLSKVILENGRIGFVQTSDLETYSIDFIQSSLNEVRPEHDYGDDVHVTWTQIPSYKSNPDLSIEDQHTSLDAISPTWFSLNINGIIINEADFRYMKDAHEKGYEVWGLFSNSFKPSWTSEMLNDETFRKRAIAQIVFYSALYDLDGVNIDYENMYLDDQDAFTQFMAELYSVLKEQNVVLSIDVTIPEGSDQWSKVYDRESLAKHVDYMILMAYDEFWASSPISGPVSSIPWVETNLEKTLEMVPNEKLILGVPLFMRVWEEYGSSVSSKAIGIKHLEEVLEDKEYEESYDEEAFLIYITYREDDRLHRIWVEDVKSLEKRLALMRKYNLPGIATWSEDFIESETWEYFDEKLD